MNTTIIAGIIQSLSIILLGVVGWFLKQLYNDIRVMRTELTILQTEHSMLKEAGACPLMRKHEV